MSSFLRKNLSLKILSVFFAIVLWSYVIGETNPTRIKTVSDVQVKFLNENTLKTQNLIIKDEAAKKNKKINVSVELKQKDFSNATSDTIDASVDLSKINQAGKFHLKITAVSRATGKVVSIYPDNVELDVDQIETRSVPVHIQQSGEVPSGYWSGDISVNPKTVDVTGAKSDVDRIEQAGVVLSLKDVKHNINKVMNFTLYDKNGKEVDGDFSTVTSGITLSVPVYPVKQFDVNAGQHLIAQNITNGLPLLGTVKKGYKIKEIDVSPSSVLVAGDLNILKNIKDISIQPIDVQNAISDISVDAKLDVPKGVKLLSSDTVRVIIRINEEQDQKTFDSIGITSKNLGSGLNATYNINTAKFIVKADSSIIKNLKSTDVQLYIDLTGCGKGDYEIPIQAVLPNGVESVSIIPDKVKVKID